MKSFLLGVLALALSAVSGSAARLPDFEAAHGENLTNLQRFIQIDSSNPLGNETKGALFLKGIWTSKASEIVERVPGRGNLTARLKDRGKKKPILLDP